MSTTDTVRIWEEQISIPTYPAMPADPNPMFLEKRVYQGSSGKVYPNPFTDRVSLEKTDRLYKAVFLENEYVQLMVLPEIGGRIHIGHDKTNDYDFFYRQHVIKPALVGLLGPWISGGVEFNWPQHHRPSTFMPVHASIEQGEDGSATVWLSEHDPMNRMKGMVGICLHPGRSIIEAKVRLYNRTPFVQTFLWWANVAVRVHDQYQAFFPPDVTFVADHAKRAISHFPIARNLYYGVDYTGGVDISWYKNIPVPTSYMVTQSKYNFFGGYDYAREAGFIHVADHHIAPGKKLWTWGNAEFGYAWDRNLTDKDGPYVELMAGVYTDNQPDFSWLQPYETKAFNHIWYPIQKIGPAVCANERLALSLKQENNAIRLGLCSSEKIDQCSVTVADGNKALLTQTINLVPGQPWIGSIPIHKEIEGLEVTVRAADGALLIQYRVENAEEAPLPKPATEPPDPTEIRSTDELYITGLHLEQYRHATRSPEPYWEEGLRRDPEDTRLNNAMGLAALRRGEFAKAEEYFRHAIGRLTVRNPNPRDGEPYYNLGLALFYQAKLNDAYAAFYKSIWSYAWRGAGHYALAAIDSARGEIQSSLAHLDESLAADSRSLAARDLKAALLRKLGRTEEARKLVEDTLCQDSLDFRALAEIALLMQTEAQWATQLQDDVQTVLDIVFDYATAGLFFEAYRLLTVFAEVSGTQYPMVFYALAAFAGKMGHTDDERHLRQRAAQALPLYCFPSRLEEMKVLEQAIQKVPSDAKAQYYLGNLYYDRKRYKNAITCWESSVALDPGFSIPWRNLGIAEFNVNNNADTAFTCYKKAVEVNPQDARLFYEFDQLKKRMNVAPEQRLAEMEAHSDLVAQRDDLTIEHITLLVLTNSAERALTIMNGRRFSPWEGGEGLISSQYVQAHMQLGRYALERNDYETALSHFQAAHHYPENLGEGKHLLTLERSLDYFEGLALEHSGKIEEARGCYSSAARPLAAYSIHSYYRALALRRLGRGQEADSVMREMIEYADKQINVEPKIDYFATSLPNFLLFEDNLKSRNTVECLLLKAYGELGLGNTELASNFFHRVLEMDAASIEARQELARPSLTPTAQERPNA
ncbi:MAG TPA: DUF5107 domain-containing protein [Edaphobacter sp.]|nr:DUF5107 domain-containing protein [Edaphobacter sp.]